MNNRPLHILQVHGWWDTERPGGVISVMRDIQEGLTERGHRSTILACEWHSVKLTPKDSPNGPYYSRRVAGLPKNWWDLRGLSSFLFSLPSTLRDLKKLCQDEKIDVIHLHYPFSYQFPFAPLRWIGGPPYIVTFHLGDANRFQEQSTMQQSSLRYLFNRAFELIAVSAWLADTAYVKVGGIQKPVVLPNGVSTPDPTEDAALPDFALQTNDFAVAAGVLAPYKGFDIAIQAWKIAADQGFDLPLFIFGEGADREKLEQMIAELGLTDLVHLAGYLPRDQLFQTMKKAKFLIAPSRREGLGLMLIEGILNGALAICSDIPPFREIMAGARKEAIFPSEDPQGLVDALLHLTADPDIYDHCLRSQREQVGDRFNMARMVDAYIDTYQRARDAS